MRREDVELHVEQLRIDPELLRRAGVRRVNDSEGREILGLNGKPGTFAGVCYPYTSPITGRTTTHRVRLDTPDGGKKYRQPYGDHRHLFFPPGAAALLADVSAPVVIVESEKASLALTAVSTRAQRPLLVVALGGCWNFLGRIGIVTTASGAREPEKGPLPDFALITWTGRECFIAFDARPNNSVKASRDRLARIVRPWGATVRHVHLPEDDDRVSGPDDLVRWHGDDAFWRAIDRAVPEDFIRFTKGPRKDEIVPDSLDNIRIALARLGVQTCYDAFAREALIDGTPADDVALDRLWVAIDDSLHFRPTKETLATVVITEAHATTVHPVRAYLDRLTWDGTPRLDTWLSAYAGAADTPYVRAVGALPLIAAVRRVRQPACKFDELLILEGPQGTLKSSALRVLCPDDRWFSDDLPLGVDSKLVIERTTGRWLIEAAELHGNRGREAEQLKGFLSRQVDGPVRLAYGRLPVTVPRQFVIIGSTNSRLGYLKDGTGGRRFWPVRIENFDVEALSRDRDQLWAEAAAREQAGASIRLASALWLAAADEQEERRAVDPWESVLEPLLDGDGVVVKDFVSSEAVWEALKLEASSLNNQHADRVTAIVQRYGFVFKTRRWINGRQRRGWATQKDTRSE